MVENEATVEMEREDRDEMKPRAANVAVDEVDVMLHFLRGCGIPEDDLGETLG